MKTRKMGLVLVILLCCALLGTAAADVRLTEYPLNNVRNVDLNPVSGDLTILLKGGDYQIFNTEGTTALSDPYESIYFRNQGYYKVEKGGKEGLLDKDAKVLVPVKYGDVSYISDRWQVGIALKASTADNYDYYNSNKYYFLIDYVDVYYRGSLIGTLSRMDWKDAEAYGDYLRVQDRENNYAFYNRELQKTPKLAILEKQKEGVQRSEYYDDYKTGKWHQGSGQLAFVPECTLTADEVTVSLSYRDGAVIDLQGNVVCRPVGCELTYFTDYTTPLLRVRNSARKYGYVNRSGEEVVSCIYDDLEQDLGAVNAIGFAYAVRDDKAGFVNVRTGEETGFEYSSNLCKARAGFFTITDLDGSLIVFAAGAGRLPGKYAEVETPYSYTYASNPLAVLKDAEGRYGVVDIYGRWVIPMDAGLEDRDRIYTTYDGTVIMIYRSIDRTYTSYRVNWTDQPGTTNTGTSTVPEIEVPSFEDVFVPAEPIADVTLAPVVETAAPAEKESWTCENGHEGNTGKFCSECGAPKPTPTPEPTQEPTPVPAADGSWTCENGHGGNTGKFCSECGAPKPVVDDGTWTCENGHGGNTGKFCSECGAAKPN